MQWYQASGSKSPQSLFVFLLAFHEGCEGFGGASILPKVGGLANIGGEAEAPKEPPKFEAGGDGTIGAIGEVVGIDKL